MLYTDGLTEARHDGELFGLGRVRATLGELADPAPAEAVEAVRARVTEFAKSPLTDALCLVAVRIG